MPPHSNQLLFYSKFFLFRLSLMPNSFAPDSLRRIRRLALAVRLLCLVGIVVMGTLPFVFWAQPDWVARVAAREWELEQMQLDLGSRLIGLAASLLPSGVILYALAQMWSLFGCFAAGELLAHRPARHLRRLGQSLCVLAFAQPLSHTAMVLALTLGNPAGHRKLQFGLSSDHYLTLMFGLLLLALAHVLGEAARVADENAEFV